MKRRSRASGLSAKILYRLYRWFMTREAMPYMKARRWTINRLTGSNSKAINIFPNVFIEGIEGLVLGENISINRDSNISAGGGIEIGNFVSIGHRCTIVSAEHNFARHDVPIQIQGMRSAKVVIADDVLIGANVTILGGVKIARGCVIGAGALVTSSVNEPNRLIGGVPAQILGSR